MKCRTCGENLSDAWVFFGGLTRCYVCLEEEREALELASSTVESEQLNRRTKAAPGTRPS